MGGHHQSDTPERATPEQVWRALEPPDLSWAKDEDGQDSPHSISHDDIYFKPGAGLDETRAVFLGGIGAPEVWQGKRRFAIGETGFGTGLNFLATLDAWLKTAEPEAQLDYLSCELHPMSVEDLSRALSAFDELGELRDELITQYPPAYPGFHQLNFVGGRVRLTLMLGEASHMFARTKAKIDAWYLDGFAPAKNPDMWQDDLYREIARLSAAGAKLATFTAAGHVRRGLKAAGFAVTKIPGFAGKYERITACYEGAPMPTKSPGTVAIIGAGIAGLSVAHALSQRGYDPIIIDNSGGRLQGASGNPAALFSPKPALGIGPYDRLQALAWLTATRFYDHMEEAGQKVWLAPRGLTILSTSSKQAGHQARIAAKFNWPGWLTGHGDKLSLRRAGSLDTAVIGRAFAADCTVIEARVGRINQDDTWQVLDTQDNLIVATDALVLANGAGLYELLDGLDDPIIPARGQIELLPADACDHRQASINAGTYLTAPVTSEHGCVRVLGASNERYPDGLPEDWREPRADDQKKSLEGLRALFPENDPVVPLASRVGIRATTHDRMPVVGAVPDPAALSTLPTHKHKFRAHHLTAEHVLEGLYMLGGLGSRGYMTAPLLGEYIASLVDGTPSPLDRDITDAISPARYPLSTKS